MKPVFSFTLFFLFASCCKMYCDGSELAVSFEMFKAIDTDTVHFVSYAPGTGRTQKVDSFSILSQISPTDTSRSSIAHSLNAAYDWEVTVPSVGKQYIFEGFDFTTEKCNCGGKKYKAIRSYLLNGVRKEGLFVAVQ